MDYSLEILYINIIILCKKDCKPKSFFLLLRFIKTLAYNYSKDLKKIFAKINIQECLINEENAYSSLYYSRRLKKKLTSLASLKLHIFNANASWCMMLSNMRSFLLLIIDKVSNCTRCFSFKNV